MSDLLPCPFCGSAASTERNIARGPANAPWAVGCDLDGCAEFAWFKTEADAIAAWNRRVTPDPLLDASLRMRERLKPDARGMVPVRKGE